MLAPLEVPVTVASYIISAFAAGWMNVPGVTVRVISRATIFLPF